MSTPESEPSTRPKALLFCPQCGREGRLPNDWTVRAVGDREAYECPACAATLTTRRRPLETVGPACPR